MKPEIKTLMLTLRFIIPEDNSNLITVRFIRNSQAVLWFVKL